MPKQLLTGTLDEQCEFLYKLAQEKMQQGNYTGAVHALKEIVKHNPEFRDAKAFLAEAKRHQAEQSQLLWFAFGGAAIFVFIGTLLQLGNDLFFIGLIAVGALLGFLVGNMVRSLRHPKNLNNNFKN
jgi:hypothetical protein